jgi:hypothetical protein
MEISAKPKSGCTRNSKKKTNVKLGEIVNFTQMESLN